MMRRAWIVLSLVTLLVAGAATSARAPGYTQRTVTTITAADSFQSDSYPVVRVLFPDGSPVPEGTHASRACFFAFNKYDGKLHMLAPDVVPDDSITSYFARCHAAGHVIMHMRES